MQEYPQRKRLRLSDYDYSSAGAYFITICTHERRCILSEVTVGALHEAPVPVLTDAGSIVRQVIEELPKRYPDLTVDHYVIMPNHIHLLLQITQADRALREAPLQQEGKRSLLAKVIGYFKMNSSKQIHAFLPEQRIWQRSYHEHVIRGEQDYREIWTYIDTNPAKWAEDRYFMDT